MVPKQAPVFSSFAAAQRDRTPEEFSSYVKRLEELAWRLVGHREEYEALMEECKLDRLTYVEALEKLVLLKSGGAD